MKKVIQGLILVPFLFGVENVFSLDEGIRSTEMRKYATDRTMKIELVHEGCRILLERRRVEPNVLTLRLGSVNSKILLGHLSSECRSMSFENQAEFLGKMVEGFSVGQETPHAEWHLSAGLLHYSFPEIAKRLAKEAAEHPDWPAVRERERLSPGAANGFLSKLANEADVYQELKVALAQIGCQVHLSGMEKVLIRPAKKLKYYDWLAEQGIDSEMDVPFGAVTWFRLKFSPTKAVIDTPPIE